MQDTDFAKEIHTALKTDFPGARLKHEPHPAQPAAPTTATEAVAALRREINHDLDLVQAAIDRLKGRL